MRAFSISRPTFLICSDQPYENGGDETGQADDLPPAERGEFPRGGLIHYAYGHDERENEGDDGKDRVPDSCEMEEPWQRLVFGLRLPLVA